MSLDGCRQVDDVLLAERVAEQRICAQNTGDRAGPVSYTHLTAKSQTDFSGLARVFSRLFALGRCLHLIACRAICNRCLLYTSMVCSPTTMALPYSCKAAAKNSAAEIESALTSTATVSYTHLDAVEDTARLLRVDQIDIDIARMLDAVVHALLGDLVEGHALVFSVLEIQQALEMPGNRLTLTVGVGRQINKVCFLGSLAQFGDCLLYTSRCV